MAAQPALVALSGWGDHERFTACITGPNAATSDGCRCFDVNRSNTVDLVDFSIVQTAFTGS